jgi:hypothetical protein
MVDTAMTPVNVGAGEFRISAVIGRTFSVFRRNLGAILMIIGLASLPYLIIDLQTAQTFQALLQHPAPDPEALQELNEKSPLSNGLQIVAIVLAVLAQNGIYYGTYQALTGQGFPVVAALRRAVVRFFPVIAVSLIFGLGVLVASLFLIVPGIILALAWMVAFQACVVEELGPLKSLSRSAALTKGHRWKIFGTVILAFIGTLISFGVIFAAIFAAIYALHSGVAFAIGQFLLQVLLLSLASIFPAVVYYELRLAKEGVGAEKIAVVFD